MVVLVSQIEHYPIGCSFLGWMVVKVVAVGVSNCVCVCVRVPTSACVLTNCPSVRVFGEFQQTGESRRPGRAAALRK